MKNSSQQAFSLIEALASISLIGIAFTVMVSQISYDFAALQYIKLTSELNVLSQYLRDNIDCQATLNEAISETGQVRCPSPRQVTLKKADASNLPNLINGWSLRAICRSDGLYVEAQKLTERGDVAKDPKTGKLLSFDNNDINPVLGGASRQNACAAYFFESVGVIYVPVNGNEFTAQKCRRLIPNHPGSRSVDISNPNAIAEVNELMSIWDRMDRKCLDVCRQQYYRTGGYMADCDRNQGGGRCACYR